MLDKNVQKWIASQQLNNDEVQPLTGDASSRQYWRVGESGLILGRDPNPESFQNFLEIQNFLNEQSTRTPEIKSTLDNEYYLLEDLGDQTFLLELSNISHDGEYDLYRRAIDIIIKLQKNSSVVPEVVQNRSFDKEKLGFEVNMTAKFFLEKMLGISEKQINEIKNDFNLILEELVNKPRCFVHRDYHSRNLMLKNDELVVIDFQDARMGLPHYDLVSLLEDCYIDTGSLNRKKLIKYYWENSNKELFNTDNFDYFMQTYYLTLLQRVFKAIGSFAYIYKTRDDIRYLKYIGFAMEKMRRTLREVNLETNLRTSLLKPYYES